MSSRNTFLMGLAAAILVFQIALAEPAKISITNEHSSFVEKCLTDFDAIKIGMTRNQVLKLLPLDAGVNRRVKPRFRHPDCRYFKLDVEFEMKQSKSDPTRAVSSEDDKVISISKPYIERPNY